MTSITELYSLQNSGSQPGIEGYHVDNKYYDPIKMRQQRILSQSKDKPKTKPVNVSKKTTFIDDVEKQAAKLPGPFSYEPVDLNKSKIKIDTATHPNRETFIDQIQKMARKKSVPGAGTYVKIETDVDKSKLRSNLRKGEAPNFIEGSMRNSIEAPGVGQYNAYRAVLDHRGSKWAADNEKNIKKSTVKLPSVGSYNPRPVSYSLFQSTSPSNKKVAHGFGGKTQRFKTSKQKKLPFYNVLSQWGMKDKQQKKDILTKISSHPGSNRSVYY